MKHIRTDTEHYLFCWTPNQLSIIYVSISANSANLPLFVIAFVAATTNGNSFISTNPHRREHEWTERSIPNMFVYVY